MNLNNKKTNIIVTSVILVIALVITAITGVQFYSFSKFQAQFYTQDVDEILHFSEFSPTLVNTVGDSEIYVKYGNQNTVALVKAENASKYASADSITSSTKIAAVAGSTQLAAAQTSLQDAVISEMSDHTAVVEAVKSGAAEVGIVAYGDARSALSGGDLVVADAEIEKVPSILVMGGTHPNEPSGQLTAVMYLENAVVERGILYVITEVNKSAYTHSQPQEATTWYYDLETASGGTRTFKFGARATNTNDQWPNPDMYVHSSGQSLSSSEVRNINRAYPGSINGNYTERLAYAVAEFIRQKDVTIVIDLHEASPEYITINAMVAHNDSANLGSKATDFIMSMYEATTADGQTIDGVDISFEVSPLTMHGLTHRELGDYTNAYVFLLETSNASQGKLRGAFTEDLITYAKPDKFYEFAAGLDAKYHTNILYARPVSINERVARHSYSVQSIIQAFNENGGISRYVNVSQREDQKGTGGEYLGDLIINNIPEYVDYIDNGVGYYLKDLA